MTVLKKKNYQFVVLKAQKSSLTRLSRLISVALVLLTSAALSKEFTLIERPMLSLGIAKEIAKACEKRQLSNNRPPVAIAIFDQGANLLLFHRMTYASLGSTAVAMEKGKSAAHFPIATRQWEVASYGNNGSPGIALLPNITALAGGIPIITSSGIHLGGIGVSGSSADDDEACALEALNAVRKYLIATP